MCGAECMTAWLAPNCPRRGLSLSSIQDLGSIQVSPMQARAKVPQFNGKHALKTASSEDKNDLPLATSFGSSQLLEPMCRLPGCATLPQFTKDGAPVKILSNLVRKTLGMHTVQPFVCWCVSQRVTGRAYLEVRIQLVRLCNVSRKP